MINTDMRYYDYHSYGDDNGYGQPVLSELPTGQVKMAINISNQSTQDNINYKDAQYVGLTNSAVDDSMVILYDNKRLKVLYVNPKGRLKQVFMAEL